MVRLLSKIGAGVLVLSACGSSEDETYFQSYIEEEIDIASVPTVTDGEGKPLGSTWRAQAYISKNVKDGEPRGTVRIFFEEKDGAKLGFEYGSHDSAPTSYEVVRGKMGGYAEAPGKMAISLRTASGDATQVEGRAALTKSRISDGTRDSFAFEADLTDVTASGPGGPFKIDGKVAVSGRKAASSSSGGSSGGSSGSSGSGGDCGSYRDSGISDVQAKSFCQAAYSYKCQKNTKGVQSSCDTLKKLSSSDASKCPYC